MRLNEHVLEITGKAEEYGEWFYWVSMFGTPSPEQAAKDVAIRLPRRPSRVAIQGQSIRELWPS